MLFSAEITDVKTITNILKAITFKELVVIKPMEEGIKFTLDEMRDVETSLYIPRDIFLSYNLQQQSTEIAFKLNIKILTECLNIFGDDQHCTVKLAYKHIGSPLSLVVKHNDENVTVDCEINTINMDDVSDISLGAECNVNKVIIDAALLTELLQRLDNYSEELTVCLDPDKPHFTLTATGIAGESTVSISKYEDCFTIFECQKKTEAVYNFSTIRPIIKVMQYASRVSISSSEIGLLGFQLLIMCDDKKIFIEYYVTSQFQD